MIGKSLLVTLFFITSAHAGLEAEIAQQKATEDYLEAELEAQKELAKQAYQDVFELASTSTLHRDEQLERLEDAYKIWDEFIEKTCRAEVLESIRTRAESTDRLTCMVKRFKEKELFFKSII